MPDGGQVDGWDRKLVEFSRWILKSTKGSDAEMVLAFIIYSRVCGTDLMMGKKSGSGWWRERVLGCCLLISIKVLREGSALPSNRQIAHYLSLQLGELNRLERELLGAVEYRVQATTEEYNEFSKKLEKKKKRAHIPHVEEDQEKAEGVISSDEKVVSKCASATPPPVVVAQKCKAKRLHSSLHTTSPCALPSQPMKKFRRG